MRRVFGMTGQGLISILHGFGLGFSLLLVLAASLGVWGVNPGSRALARLLCAAATLAWAACMVGSFVVYPWYRDKSPESAKNSLVAKAETKAWHEFGMEWKEHAAWLAPFLLAPAAFIAKTYREELAVRAEIRRMVGALTLAAFAAAAIAGILGALIARVEAVQ